ncbi:dephospho-CoA kinase [Cruoricaptor ignavus]|uniref:dephospho-CoA kinase n=1 Tax=Cruoricaptor ignavus TaxID=1118202 RepID=UPI00370D72D1
MENSEGRSAKPEPEPKIIGLTGGIGSGKTTAANIIERSGFPVYYSDGRAKSIVNDDAVLREKIISLLGAEAYDESGLYNRKFVSSQVFERPDLLENLNSLIHPAVRQDFEKWLSAQSSRFVFKETALLFELGLDENCFKSLLITADDRLRIKRVMDRDGKTYREVEAVMENQMPEKEKIKKADFIIFNNDTQEALEEEVSKFLTELEDF